MHPPPFLLQFLFLASYTHPYFIALRVPASAFGTHLQAPCAAPPCEAVLPVACSDRSQGLDANAQCTPHIPPSSSFLPSSYVRIRILIHGPTPSMTSPHRGSAISTFGCGARSQRRRHCIPIYGAVARCLSQGSCVTQPWRGKARKTSKLIFTVSKFLDNHRRLSPHIQGTTYLTEYM